MLISNSLRAEIPLFERSLLNATNSSSSPMKNPCSSLHMYLSLKWSCLSVYTWVCSILNKNIILAIWSQLISFSFYVMSIYFWISWEPALSETYFYILRKALSLSSMKLFVMIGCYKIKKMFECRSVVQLKPSPFDIVLQPWDASDLTNMRLKSCNILWLMGIYFTNFPSILKLKLTRPRFLDHQSQMVNFDCINVHIQNSQLDLVECGPPAQPLQFPVC